MKRGLSFTRGDGRNDPTVTRLTLRALHSCSPSAIGRSSRSPTVTSLRWFDSAIATQSSIQNKQKAPLIVGHSVCWWRWAESTSKSLNILIHYILRILSARRLGSVLPRALARAPAPVRYSRIMLRK
jgi:hypothetical protein